MFLLWMAYCVGKWHIQQSNAGFIQHSKAIEALGAIDTLDIYGRGKILRPVSLSFKNPRNGIALKPSVQRIGSPSFYSNEAILRSIIADSMTEREKSLAIWEFVARYVSCEAPKSTGHDLHDPVRLFNIYGGGYCDDVATALATLCRIAGIDARIWVLEGHAVSEVFFEDKWHLLDAMPKVYFPDEDGDIASVEYVAANPQLVDKYYDGGYITTGSYKSVIASTGDNYVNDYYLNRQTSHRMDYVLYPGDRVDFTFLRNDELNIQRLFIYDYTPKYFGKGKLKRSLHQLSKGHASEWIWKEHWPYGVSQVEASVFLKKGIKPENITIRFSTDSIGWIEGKRELTDNVVRFVFEEKDIGDSMSVFSFFLKGKSSDSNLPAFASALDSVIVTSRFRFAPRSLLDFRDPPYRFEIRSEGLHTREKTNQGLQVTITWEEKPTE